MKIELPFSKKVFDEVAYPYAQKYKNFNFGINTWQDIYMMLLEHTAKKYHLLQPGQDEQKFFKTIIHRQLAGRVREVKYRQEHYILP